MSENREMWKRGVKDGVPIFLGYLAVSFSFGIAAKGSGLSVLQSTLMSLMNLTSAGQLASLELIAKAAPYLELALVQLVVNIRYCLMSCVISQRLDLKSTRLRHRLAMAFGLSDEIFALSAAVPGKLSPYYTFGLMTLAIPGWVLGTFLGALSGSILPARILSALGVGLYVMFVAIVTPKVRESRVMAGVVIASMLLSLVFSQVPALAGMSSGVKIIILSVLISGLAAFFFPVKDEQEQQAPALQEEADGC